MKYILILMLIGRFGEISDVKFFETKDKQECEFRGQQAVDYYKQHQNLTVQYKCVVDA